MRQKLTRGRDASHYRHPRKGPVGEGRVEETAGERQLLKAEPTVTSRIIMGRTHIAVHPPVATLRKGTGGITLNTK